MPAEPMANTMDRNFSMSNASAHPWPRTSNGASANACEGGRLSPRVSTLRTLLVHIGRVAEILNGRGYHHLTSSMCSWPIAGLRSSDLGTASGGATMGELQSQMYRLCTRRTATCSKKKNRFVIRQTCRETRAPLSSRVPLTLVLNQQHPERS